MAAMRHDQRDFLHHRVMWRTWQQRYTFWRVECRSVQRGPNSRDTVHSGMRHGIDRALQRSGLTLICGAEGDQDSQTVATRLPGIYPRIRPIGIIQQWSDISHVRRKMISGKIQRLAHRNQETLGAVEQGQDMLHRIKSLTRPGLIEHWQPLIHDGEVLICGGFDLCVVFPCSRSRQATSQRRDTWHWPQTDCWREERARNADRLRRQCRSEQGGIADRPPSGWVRGDPLLPMMRPRSCMAFAPHRRWPAPT